MPNIPPLEDQGLVMIVCSHCGSIWYDLLRPNRIGLYCVYCGKRMGSL